MLLVFRPLVVGAMLPILLLLTPPFYATARVNIARFSAVGFRRYAVHFIHVGAAFYPTSRVNAARFAAVGVGFMLPFLLLLVPLFTKPRG